MNSHQPNRAGRLKTVAAVVGAGAAIAGATVAVGVANADNDDVISGTTTTTETSISILPPEEGEYDGPTLVPPTSTTPTE